MTPGDNYKIAASTNQTRLGEMTQAMADGQETLPATVVLSSMLTTWRKLWIERDSMDTVAQTGDEKNFFEGTADSYTKDGVHTIVDLGEILPVIWNDKENHFSAGKYKVDTRSYIVHSNTKNLIFDDEAKVYGDPVGGGSVAPEDYKLYDDDTATLPSYLTLGRWKDKFQEAYIKIEY